MKKETMTLVAEGLEEIGFISLDHGPGYVKGIIQESVVGVFLGCDECKYHCVLGGAYTRGLLERDLWQESIDGEVASWCCDTFKEALAIVALWASKK